MSRARPLCLRRDTLQAIGGLATLANHLADDHRLGELVRAAGQRIVLSPYVVQGEHHEPSLDSLVRHELRWMRTIRVLRPRSFRFIFITFSLPLAALGIAAAAPGVAAFHGRLGAFRHELWRRGWCCISCIGCAMIRKPLRISGCCRCAIC